MQHDLFAVQHEPVQAKTSSAAASGLAARQVSYRKALFAGVPLYTTRLVREGYFAFPERTQVRTPAEVAAVLQAYFQDRGVSYGWVATRMGRL